jgi:ankyrin repeat protein
MAIHDIDVSAETRHFLRQNGLNLDNLPDRCVAIIKATTAKLPNVIDDLLKLHPKNCTRATDRDGAVGGRKDWTALHYAARSGSSDIALKLLEKGADVNARTPGGWTPLILAAENGRSETVHLLLQKGADVDAQTQARRPTVGLTALHRAATLEDPETILTLLLHGADAGLTTVDKDTPLHYAVKAGCLRATALLLFHGASATAANRKNVTPRRLVDSMGSRDKKKAEHIFDCAVGDGKHWTLVKDFLNPGPPRDMAKAIHWAVDKNLDRAIAYILHVDPYAVEAQNRQKRHPLHVATLRKLTDCIKVLLQHGADPNATTRTGWTPLMLAADTGDLAAISLLLDNGAKRDLRNGAKQTALDIARVHNNLLAEHFLRVNHVDPSDAAAAAATAPTETSEERTNGATLAPVQEFLRRTPSPGPGQETEAEGRSSQKHASISAPADLKRRALCPERRSPKSKSYLACSKVRELFQFAPRVILVVITFSETEGIDAGSNMT